MRRAVFKYELGGSRTYLIDLIDKQYISSRDKKLKIQKLTETTSTSENQEYN